MTIYIGFFPVYVRSSEFLLSHHISMQFHALVVGSNYPAINSDDVKKLKIISPPLPTQNKVADILSCWDDAIQKLERLHNAKIQQKNSSLVKILGNKNWPLIRLSDIGDIASAGVNKKILDGEMSVRLVNFLDVLKRDFLFDFEITHESSTSEKKIRGCDVRRGDVLFTPSSEVQGDIAHSAVVIEDIPNAVYSYHLVRLRFKQEVDLLFKAYLFKSNHFLKQANRLCVGSGQRYVISLDTFRQMNIYLPNLEQQVKIGKYFFEADKEIALLKRNIEALNLQKRGLMQKLF